MRTHYKDLDSSTTKEICVQGLVNFTIVNLHDKIIKRIKSLSIVGKPNKRGERMRDNQHHLIKVTNKQKCTFRLCDILSPNKIIWDISLNSWCNYNEVLL